MVGKGDDGGRLADVWQMGCEEEAALTVAKVDDEGDHVDHPRRVGDGGSLGWGSVARKFGHRFLGAVIINQRFASGSCGDESSRGGVIERPR